MVEVLAEAIREIGCRVWHGIGLIRGDVDRRAHSREWSAELVSGICDELPLRAK